MLKQEKLGSGTYGIVYAAKSLDEEENYAIKRNLADKFSDFISSIRELYISSQLNGHPFVVDTKKIVFGNPFANAILSPISEEEAREAKDDKIHFVMERCMCNLSELLSKKNVGYKTLKKFMVQILLAVEFMHSRKIIHRDIKPHNILVEERDGELNAKICDFGMAKSYSMQCNQTPQVVTAWYRAPEILLEDPSYDFRSDIWSLGCLFFEMIAGKAFLSGVIDDPSALINKILALMPVQVKKNVIQQIINRSEIEIEIRNYSRIRRLPFIEQMQLSKAKIRSFERSCGQLLEFGDLLNKMLCFDPKHRVTVTRLLEHKFFADYRAYISKIRHEFPPIEPNPPKVTLVPCIERRWVFEIAESVFHSRKHLFWYSHRILFQALDIFDRYLYYLDENDKYKDRKEGKLRGRFHTQEEVELRFLACLYMAIKFYSSLGGCASFADIADKMYHNEKSFAIVEEFEEHLLLNVLGLQVYRETILEAADISGKRLKDEEVAELLDFISQLHSFEVKDTTYYKLFRTFLIAKKASKLRK